MNDSDRQQAPQRTSEHEAPHGQAPQVGRRDRDLPTSTLLVERAKTFRDDAQALSTSVQETAELFRRYVSEQAEQRPYTTIGVAAGVGYLLGGGLATRITSTALGTAYRLGLALAARELSQRVLTPDGGHESSRAGGSPR